ncbi:MAG TPA: PAS domain S-box protein, partial [Planctomycetota bacterium]|nr:PAS domain S-box protein [Planctomycetota bacterium]
MNRPRWLMPPTFADRDVTASARNVYVLCAICIPCLLLTGARNWFAGQTPEVLWELLAETLCVGVVFALNQSGRVHAASVLLTSSLVGLTTLILCTSQDGSHDTAILVYPCTLVLAGLLLEWRALILVTLVTILCVTAIVTAEIHGVLVNRFSATTRWGDVFDMTIILAGTAGILGVWAAQLRTSIARTRQSQEAIEQSNRELAAQAGRLANVARELHESEARQRAILASSLDGLIVIDTRGSVVEFNPAAERIFGYPRAQTIGRQMADLIVPPALREEHRQGMAKYLATQTGKIIGKQVEMPALHANGSEFRIELTVAPVPGTEPLLFAGVVRDITERIR